jgi:hypothetical protein
MFVADEITFTMYRWLDRQQTQLMATYRGVAVCRVLQMVKDDIDFRLARKWAEQEMVGALRYLAEETTR